ncbi:carbamoyltransferase C-terminal domain-containing protein [Hydrogeniiclostridium mannosilyticum]|uniref:carbamoyltransferase C-terminal domain-containing protein n=1 Tax=Hydrogeniiclostridium mannosilyticum TaxID=2764322 RepID=UPI00399B5CC0
MQNSLRDGYYLSIYSEIDPIFNIKSYSLRHDHNMALFQKEGNRITLVHHWEFERITGIKHHQVAFYDKTDAASFINRLLGEYSLTLDDMCEVFGLPQLSTCDDYHSLDALKEVSYHSVCHLFTSMLMDSQVFYKENILSLAFDGGPDVVVDTNAFKKNSYCGCVSKKGKVDIFPISSPGPYWLHLSRLYDKPEGTLMALAYATTARFTGKPPTLVDNYNTSDSHKNIILLREFSDWLFSYPIDRLDEICTGYDSRFTEEENKLSMITKIVQEISLKNVYALIQDILEDYQLDPKNTFVSLSGGYGLNCPTNTGIMHQFGFMGQLICPCVNDSGMAIGMGLYYFFKYCDVFDYRFSTAFYGDSDNNLESAAEAFSPFIKQIYHGTEQAGNDIINEPVVWFDARSESGPRALGHRSILANPAKNDSKDLLNTFKKREWWRPVAPIILENELEKWFLSSFPSPYMLNNFKVKPEKKDMIDAVLHLNDTARIQTITEEDNDRLFSVITDIFQKTGIPIICNTSLNDKGEPIVNRISEALNFALRKGIRLVYVNGSRIELHNHNQFSETCPAQREDHLFRKNSEDKGLLSLWNPHQLTITEILIRKFNSELHEFDITSKRDVKILKSIIKKIRTVSDIYDDLFELILL